MSKPIHPSNALQSSSQSRHQKPFPLQRSSFWQKAIVQGLILTIPFWGLIRPVLAQDYGDAPDTGSGTGNGNYQTTNADSGPSQATSTTIRIGTQVDSDTGTLQNSNASLDDTTNTGSTDDEEGVTTLTFVKNSNSVYVIPVSVTNNSGSDAFLAGFIDFNQDGDFTDTNERSTSILTVVSNATNPRTVYLTFDSTAVNNATLGTTYARFRMSSNSIETGSSVGASTNSGEVEDYPFTIVAAPTPGTPSTCPSVSTKLQWGTTSTSDNYYLYNTGSGTSSTGTLSGANPQTAIFTNIAGATDLRMSFSGNTSLLLDQASLGGAIETSTDLFDGGFSPAQPSLNLNINGARDAFATTVIEFIDVPNSNNPIAIDNISFSIFDVDRSTTNLWQDRIAVRGYDGASLVLPQLTIQPTGGATHRFYNGAVNDVIATGGDTLRTGPPASAGGNVGVLFTDPITRFEIDYYNGYQAPLNSSQHAIGLIGSIDFCSADFGDAPDTYGTDVTATNNGTDPFGASHTYNKRLSIGNTLPDLEINAATPYNGTGDDSTDIDDEDTIAINGLATNTTTYNLTVPVNNTTGSAATLVGWIDFDRDGIFQADEGTSVAVPNGTENVTLAWTNIADIQAGASYARLRLSTDSITTANVGGSFGSGEVEDHTLTITSPVASDPDLLLVKRITQLIPGDGSSVIPYNSFVDDGEDKNGDTIIDNNDPGWPVDYIDGVIGLSNINNDQIVKASPGDVVEYTIYFLNTGDGAASNVQICDALKDFITYLPNTYNPIVTNAGIELNFNGSSGNDRYLTGVNDGDQGEFVNAGIVSGCQIENPGTPPPDLVPLDNPNGTVKVDLTSNISASTGIGTPANSYGYIRFRAKVE